MAIGKFGHWIQVGKSICVNMMQVFFTFWMSKYFCVNMMQVFYILDDFGVCGSLCKSGCSNTISVTWRTDGTGHHYSVARGNTNTQLLRERQIHRVDRGKADTHILFEIQIHHVDRSSTKSPLKCEM